LVALLVLCVSGAPGCADAVPGLIYQFRVRSFHDKNGTRDYIALSEGLKGVFRWLPAGE
jgi:hypothetical protein